MGLGNLYLLRAAQESWAHPRWGMGRLDDCGSNSEPSWGEEGALEGAGHCPQPSVPRWPSEVRTIIPILQTRRWKLRVVSQGMAKPPALQSPNLACHARLYTSPGVLGTGEFGIAQWMGQR